MNNLDVSYVTTHFQGYFPDSNPSSETSERTVSTSESPKKDQKSRDQSNRPHARAGSGAYKGLTKAEIEEVVKLKRRDQEVKIHEGAHLAAIGPYVKGGANYDYQQGPDGNTYAVGGDVKIDASKIPGDLEATAKKMETIKRAALAPARPSGRDKLVAARASRMENQTRLEILLKRFDDETPEGGKERKAEQVRHVDTIA